MSTEMYFFIGLIVSTFIISKWDRTYRANYGKDTEVWLSLVAIMAGITIWPILIIMYLKDYYEGE